jgi:hypothetical protein
MGEPAEYVVTHGAAYWLDGDDDLNAAPQNADGSIDWAASGLVGEAFDAEAERARQAVIAAFAALTRLAELY